MNNNRDICFIQDLQVLEDAAGLFTRIYPEGQGNAGARVTLAEATITMPADYVMDTANNYIRRVSAETAYGQIDYRETFKDIGAIGGSGVRDQSASNQLALAALTKLQMHSAPFRSYSFSVVGLNRRVRPGDLIRVNYREYREGYTAINLDETMVILEPTVRFDQSGVKTVAMVVAPVTMARYPVTDAEIQSRMMEQLRRQMALPQAVSGKQVR